MPRLTTIVPAKRCSLAKQRLADIFSAEERSELAKVMFHDVMTALKNVRPATHVVVATADGELAAIATGYGLEVMADPWEQGVTRTVTEAAKVAAARGFDAAMIIPADVPLVQPGELSALFAAHTGRGITLVPAEHDHGTNAIIASPPTAIAFCYGPDSFMRHIDQARKVGLTPFVMQVPGLNLDVDRPSDLARVLASPRPTRTKAFLAGLGRTFDDCAPRMPPKAAPPAANGMSRPCRSS